MFRAILYTQWKWSRLVLLVGVVASFALPLLSVQQAGWPGTSRFDAMQILGGVQSWSVWYPSLAAGLGLMLATTAWGADHRTGHVYALSLPVPRWHFAVLRFGAGVTLLAAPLAAFWIGSMLAAAAVQLPPGLHAYPHALAVRFALAVFMAYALFSAISAGTARAAGYVLGVIGALVWIQVMLNVAGSDLSLVEAVFDRLAIWPGPLEVFTGRWTLIDV